MEGCCLRHSDTTLAAVNITRLWAVSRCQPAPPSSQRTDTQPGGIVSSMLPPEMIERLSRRRRRKVVVAAAFTRGGSMDLQTLSCARHVRQITRKDEDAE